MSNARAQVSPETIAFLVSKGVPMSQILPLLQGAPQAVPSVPQVEAPKKRGRKLGSKNKPKTSESAAPIQAAPTPTPNVQRIESVLEVSQGKNTGVASYHRTEKSLTLKLKGFCLGQGIYLTGPQIRLLSKLFREHDAELLARADVIDAAYAASQAVGK